MTCFCFFDLLWIITHSKVCFPPWMGYGMGYDRNKSLMLPKGKFTVIQRVSTFLVQLRSLVSRPALLCCLFVYDQTREYPRGRNTLLTPISPFRSLSKIFLVFCESFPYTRVSSGHSRKCVTLLNLMTDLKFFFTNLAPLGRVGL